MAIHPEPSPVAGKQLLIIAGPYAGDTIRIEDWWDRVAGKSWMDCDGNPACLRYAIDRVGSAPIDNDVLYGGGRLVHVSWLAGVA
ncbi:MAG: hypothetical protein U5M50_10530 [Sphingobium sp.]|nr:hypothetical protein [Sphingobium sp.]